MASTRLRESISGWIAWLIPSLLFLATFMAITLTIVDYGLTDDETDYIESAKGIEFWFKNALGAQNFFEYDVMSPYWKMPLIESLLVGNVHPPFYKLSAIVFRHLLGMSLFDIELFQYRLSTAFWTAVLVLMIYLVVKRFTGSIIWALLGGLIFITTPAFFAHAHFFTTDMLITVLGFAGLVAFVFAPRPWQRILLGGILFGAALATKFTGIMSLGIAAALIVTADDRKRFVLEYLAMALTACAFFAVFNLPVLFNPEREISFYFSAFLDREKRFPNPTLYFGKIYDFRMPFHQPWVMFGITLPPLVVVTTVIGLVCGSVNFLRTRDRFAYFAAAPFLLCMGMYMLPTTPKHDGIRLFSTAWPFIALLSVYGCRSLQNVSIMRLQAGKIAAVVTIVSASWALIANHPYQLNYYNQFIGGSKGAEDTGFSVSYWHDPLNRDFFRELAGKIGTEETNVYAHKGAESIIISNQIYGLSPTKMKPVGYQDQYKYVLVLNRILTPEMREYLQACKPVLELKTRDGAFIAGMYMNK
jgi:hypothetical protein